MEREFYYLDEKVQKGPLNIEQLKFVGLKPDTLVWTDGFDKWKQVKEVDELKVFLKSTPPPPPIVDNSFNSTSNNIENQDDKRIQVEDSNLKFWISFKIIVSFLMLISLGVFSAYQISNNKKEKLKEEIYVKIENILDGKTVVLDGTYSLTEGELSETEYNSKNKIKSGDPILDIHLQSWGESEKLYTVYTASSGGFIIKQLTKRNNDSYDIETSYSGDMGYKRPYKSYMPAQYVDDGLGGRYKITGGYFSNNFRPSVRECYRLAFEYFTKEDKKSPGAYSAGKYVDISNFPEIRNQYFYMDNTNPKKHSTSGISSSSWESYSEHGANINTDSWVVYYKTYGKHYEISENKELINKELFINISIIVGTFLFLLFIIYFSKPNYFRNLNLYGKRWRNESYQDQIFYFEHSFFSKHTFSEIINEKVSKGILKFTDKGNTINLSYLNKELFYKIENIDRDFLKLVSVNDKSIIVFRRVGAKFKREAI